MKCNTLKNNSGFTLVELIVTIAIAGILMTAIGSVFIFGSNLVNTTQSKFNEHSAALALENKIKAQVQFANALTIYTDPSQLSSVAETNSIYFGTNPYVSGGTSNNCGLVIKNSSNTSVFMQGGFIGYSCSVTFTKVSGTALGIKVVITNLKDADDAYTLLQTISLSNFGTGVSGSAASIGGQTSGTLIGFNVYSPPS